jgi:transposase
MRKEPVMKKVRFLGLDVHADTIAVAVAEPDGEVRSLGMIPNRPESIRKLMKKLGPPASLQVCYEAGPTGYVIYWQLTALGVPCEVVAPTLVPTKAGDRVKTDRRDAAKLARSFRAGDLTAVWVPDAAHEALRDLVRAREAAKKDQLRAPSARQISAAPRTAAVDEDDGVDPAAPGVDPPGAVRAPGPGGHAAGLSARSRSRGRAHRTARARDR